ncbi:hypothetical protein SCG7109_BI_00030 [Chlamydiales bacterium SCGC AG-110-M15]|nr:hypothetical protein SCG7109_BI_00030 [Chlamydiales bacterium SCGC AG-110-M15]
MDLPGSSSSQSSGSSDGIDEILTYFNQIGSENDVDKLKNAANRSTINLSKTGRYSLVQKKRRRGSAKFDKLEALPQVFKTAIERYQTAKAISQGHESKLIRAGLKQRKELIEGALKGVKKLALECWGDDSAMGIATRHDLLETIDASVNAVSDEDSKEGLELTRLRAKDETKDSDTQKSAHRKQAAKREKVVLAVKKHFPKTRYNQIPLIKLEDVDEVIGILEQGGKEDIGFEELERRLGPFVEKEDVPSGGMIRKLYTHFSKFSGGKIGTFLASKLTKKKGNQWTVDLKKSSKTTEKITKFFAQMGIAPYMVVNGEIRSYSNVFERSLRAEPTLDAAFQRKLTPKVQAELLSKADEKTREIQSACGETAGAYFAAADSRSMFIPLPKDAIQTELTLRTKLLRNMTEEEGKIAEEGSVIDAEFPFTLQNAFGFESDVNLYQMERELTENLRLLIDKKNDESKEFTPKDEKALANTTSALTQLKFLGIIKENEWMMHIERLAPTDYHRFVRPAKGQRVLNAQDFEQRVSGGNQDSALATSLADSPRGNKQIWDIMGTLESVGGFGIQEKPGILSQNNRKIQVVEYPNGDIGFDIYIGATVIDKVNMFGSTGADSGAEAGGETYEGTGQEAGSMGAGTDTRKERLAEGWQDGLITPGQFAAKPGDLSKEDSVSVAEKEGAFAKEGSTIIHLVMKNTFMPNDSVLKAQEMSEHTVTKPGNKKAKGRMAPRRLEILTKMGNVLGASTRYHRAKHVLDSLFPIEGSLEEFVGNKGNEEVVKDIIERFLKTGLEGNEYLNSLSEPHQDLFKELYHALEGGGPKSPDQVEIRNELRSDLYRLIDGKLSSVEEDPRSGG